MTEEQERTPGEEHAPPAQRTQAGAPVDGLTGSYDDLSQVNLFIVAVPTPVTADKLPDMGPLIASSESIGALLQPGSIVIYESTVYPGATEEVCVPVLEAASGLACNRDFHVGYSPERLSPGDREHRLENTVKITSGSSNSPLSVGSSL